LNTLRFHVAEGFFRTDVLLYASICEAALYVVAKDFFNSNKQKPPDLRAAFETSVDTTTPLNDKTFTLIGSSALISGKIKICSKKVIRKKDRDISFDSLIKAARAIDAIDDDLEQKIDALREARNTIHLAAHIARKQAEPRPFAESDRQQAKQVVEQLRVQLSSYYQPF
jgi:hypothetical protein